MPSIWNERFGLVVAEGMSNGAAIITSKVEGIPEIIRKNGIVIENIDDGLLANAKDMLSQLKEIELDVVEYSKVDNTQYKINDKLEKRIKTLEQKVGK